MLAHRHVANRRQALLAVTSLYGREHFDADSIGKPVCRCWRLHYVRARVAESVAPFVLKHGSRRFMAIAIMVLEILDLIPRWSNTRRYVWFDDWRRFIIYAGCVVRRSLSTAFLNRATA